MSLITTVSAGAGAAARVPPEPAPAARALVTPPRITGSLQLYSGRRTPRLVRRLQLLTVGDSSSSVVGDGPDGNNFTTHLAGVCASAAPGPSAND